VGKENGVLYPFAITTGQESLSMIWRALADSVLFLHFSFIVFVIVGGFFAIRWRWLPWVHLPAATWGAAIEIGGWICPLTPLENWFRLASGEAGYAGGFLEHYLLRVVYPAGLTPEIQTYFGIGVLLINGVAYSLVWRARSRSL
jgi:hypothetical protein